jgi:hypothetical protein
MRHRPAMRTHICPPFRRDTSSAPRRSSNTDQRFAYLRPADPQLSALPADYAIALSRRQPGEHTLTPVRALGPMRWIMPTGPAGLTALDRRLQHPARHNPEVGIMHHTRLHDRLRNTAPIASGRPVSPSQQAISTSRTPRLRRPVKAFCQNFAHSVSAIQHPSACLRPSTSTPIAR